MTLFSASSLSSLPTAERERIIRGLSQQEALELQYLWRAWARPNQLAPDGEWRTWLILAGRGFGKTRSGAEWILERIRGGAQRIALIAATAADARDTMVEGESGILEISPPWYRPKYEPSKRRLTWPRLRTRGGSLGPRVRATTYSAEEPKRLRGPQHDTGWGDELAVWRYPETWDQFLFGLRLGTDPRACVTTTPRPTRQIRELLGEETTVATRGSTYDNRANLPKAFLERIVRKYEGTRLGRQELHAELLDDNPRALWNRDQLELLRVKAEDRPEAFRLIVVAVDPATADLEDKTPEQIEGLAATGIVVAGLGFDGRGYVLADLTGKFTPAQWAKTAIKAYDDWDADYIIGEANQGGVLVKTNIRTERRNAPVKLVHATRGKLTRAEPIAALYEQKRMRHVGAFPALEDQMCSWEPGQKSPDNMDAMVWAFTKLMIDRDPDAKGGKGASAEQPDYDTQGIGI